ncbi:MAG: ferrochelatase [Thermodesulfobacteriota bacterium]
MSRHAVVLLNLGGPDSPDAVEPFLRNLFGDHDIFRIPFGQKIFAALIAKLRTPKVRERYARIGGRSPINAWTELQAKKLERAFVAEGREIDVHVGMRYWRPAIKDAAARLSEADASKIVLLPLYPQYSITTTGSAFKEWQRAYTGPPDRLAQIDHYCDNEMYIAAVNQRIDEAVLRFPEPVRDDIQIVFSAHGTPQRLVNQGDPYSGQIRKTVERVMAKREFDHPHHLCFQSKVGPLQWLKPSTRETLADLADKNIKQILVVPISFVSDHIETLFELGIEYRETAVNAGIENYVVMQGLNDSGLFVSALKDITLQALYPAAA